MRIVAQGHMSYRPKKSKFNKCVGAKLRGKHFRTKTARGAAFSRALRQCGAKVGRNKKTKAKRAKKCSTVKYKQCVNTCQYKHGHCR
jgi:hypothetical protein